MAALAILGLALFMLLQAHYAALRIFQQSREQVLVRDLTTLALGIAELEVASGNVSGGDEFGKRFPDFTYRFEAQEVSEETPGLVEIRVIVEGPDVEEELTVLVFMPEFT